MPRAYQELACEKCGKIRRNKRKPPKPLCRGCAVSAARSIPLADRFWERVDKQGPVPAHRPELGPCHLWTGPVDDRGYGRINVRRRSVTTQRVAFFLAEGRWPMPSALHHCDNPPCVRRSHLFEGSQADNVADMDAKGRRRSRSLNGLKTHCPHGHEYTPENTYVGVAKCGGPMRICRACAYLRNARAYARRSAAQSA